jgi:hypothetical protein
VGGFTLIGGQTRGGLASFDASLATNTPTAWSPNATAGANSIAVDGSTVYAGGFFFQIGDRPQSYIASIGAGTTCVGDLVPSSGIAWLQPSRPNPFGASTMLHFGLAKPGVVNLVVYDLAGREVARLPRDRALGAGAHQTELDGRTLRAACTSVAPRPPADPAPAIARARSPVCPTPRVAAIR